MCPPVEKVVTLPAVTLSLSKVIADIAPSKVVTAPLSTITSKSLAAVTPTVLVKVRPTLLSAVNVPVPLAAVTTPVNVCAAVPVNEALPAEFARVNAVALTFEANLA
jgi:hypothetical protein